MSIPVESDISAAISELHDLASAGVPIFLARLTPAGDPIPPHGWENSRAGPPAHAAINRWKPGLALCAVTGVVLDVIDIDPRNGGDESLARFREEMGDEAPEIYWKVRTPSGGLHLYIASLGVRKRGGFLPGMDLQAGDEDGRGRGFVFLPPTVRPSKAADSAGTPRSYASTMPWSAPTAGDGSGRFLRDWLATLRPEHGIAGPARRPYPELKAAVLAAGPSEQRTALLRLVDEWHKRGFHRDEITDLLQAFLPQVPVFDEANPWWPAAGRYRNQDHWIVSLMREEGHWEADASHEEQVELGELGSGIRPVRVLSRPYSSVSDVSVSWLWLGYLAFGLLTQWDGEKGQAKTLIIADVVARATKGRGMPGAELVVSGPVDVFLLAEDDEFQMKKRLLAAGADLDRVHFPHPEWRGMVRLAKTQTETRRGKRGVPHGQDEASLLLPFGAEYIGKMIAGVGARLCVLDPVTDYLDETITTNNDASVRRALDPLAHVLSDAGCAGLSVRHMNKNTKQEARYRGGGTTAFQNRARVHLISGRIPEEVDTPGQFGLSMVDNNYMPVVPGVLPYSVVDSAVPLDDQGNMVGRVEWYDLVELDADELSAGGRNRSRGPAPATGAAIQAILSGMFSERSLWRQPEAIERIQFELESQGLPPAHLETIHKARRGARIDTRQTKEGWCWYERGKFRAVSRSQKRS